MNTNQIKGKVILAGAGPGDPDLITLKLQSALRMADVILVDRLVNPEITQRYATHDALIIVTGKQGYHDSSVSQEVITNLIIGHALDGKIVLRLKGGDVAFFSNALDELIAIKKNNIPFEIIPGITAASGASAFTGIPLTARGYSQGVRFISYNPTINFSAEKWESLAGTDDTIVIYMASKNITELSEQILRYSTKPFTPLAVIEQATTVHQQVHITTLKHCAVDFAGKEFSSPSLVILGDVVNLHHDFNWFDTQEKGSVFRTLFTNEIPAGYVSGR